MTKTRDEVQQESLQALKDANGIGTLDVQTGIGKSKITCDFIKYFENQIESVLVLVPLSPLIENWKTEFSKWLPETTCEITVETVQSAYKWVNKTYSLIIFDEVDTMVTTEYSAVFTNLRSTFKIGLTATTDVLNKVEKQLLYDAHLPIIYEYHDGEKDGVLNKTKFTIIEHELDLKHMYYVKRPKNSFTIPEKLQYQRICEFVDNGEKALAQAGSTGNWFQDATAWSWNKTGNAEEATAARKYLWAIRQRKEFLLNLRSSRDIARALLTTLLTDKKNKVLIFSELTEQARKITGDYTVWGKQNKVVNDELLKRFNAGEFRALGSCYSIGRGMNLVGVNKAIVESYIGSQTKLEQRVGRLHRLSADQTADIYLIKILNTQASVWCDSMSRELDLSNPTILTSEDIFNGKS